MTLRIHGWAPSPFVGGGAVATLATMRITTNAAMLRSRAGSKAHVVARMLEVAPTELLLERANLTPTLSVLWANGVHGSMGLARGLDWYLPKQYRVRLVDAWGIDLWFTNATAATLPAPRAVLWCELRDAGDEHEWLYP